MKIYVLFFFIVLTLNSAQGQDTLSKWHRDLRGNDSSVVIILDGIPVQRNLDTKLFYSIYNDSSAFKTSLALHFDNSVLPMSVLIPVTTFLYGRSYSKTYEENTGYLLAASEAVTFGITYGLKVIVKRYRPYNTLPWVRQKDKSTKDTFSFPSGHASTSFAVATMFALRYPKFPQAYIPMYLWGLVVSWGRPYLGMHYPSDVLSGALIGAGSSVLVYSLRRELFKFKNNTLKENKNDDGSINGGVISIFTGALLISEMMDTYIIRNNSLKIGLFPSLTGNANNMNINFLYEF